MSDLGDLRGEFRRFVDDRDWRQFHDPKSLLLALVGEVGEVAELLQWLPAAEVTARAREEPLRSRVHEELADVLLYLIGLADSLGVDLTDAAAAKLAAAAERFPVDRHHGMAPDKATN